MLYYLSYIDLKTTRLLMTKPKFALQDLINQCDESAPMNKELKEWENMQPVGKEYGSEKKRVTKSIKTVEDNE